MGGVTKTDTGFLTSMDEMEVEEMMIEDQWKEMLEDREYLDDLISEGLPIELALSVDPRSGSEDIELDGGAKIYAGMRIPESPKENVKRIRVVDIVRRMANDRTLLHIVLIKTGEKGSNVSVEDFASADWILSQFGDYRVKSFEVDMIRNRMYFSAFGWR